MKIFRNGFTVVVIPQKTSRVLRLKVSNLWMAAGSLFVVLFLVVGTYGVYRSLSVQAEIDAVNNLKNSYLRQQVALKKVSNKVDGFKTQINNLRELDYKLRLITDLQAEQPSPSLYGIGGSIDARGISSGKGVDLNKMDLITLLDKDLSRLEEMASYQEESFNNLRAFLVDQKDLLQRTPHRWPLRGFISSTYGPRTDPFTGLQRQHDGLDIVAPRGTLIKSPADGIVTYTALDPSFGNMLVIDHGYGVVTRYGHNETTLVHEGERVKRGHPVAAVGSTGKSTGPHLHYEIRIHDVAVNPLNYILD